jgi:hypothetical protein
MLVPAILSELIPLRGENLPTKRKDKKRMKRNQREFTTSMRSIYYFDARVIIVTLLAAPTQLQRYSA